MPLLKDTVKAVTRKNPTTKTTPKYLMLEVWERQGLRFYPHQRELFLSEAISSPESIARARRKVQNDE